MDSGIPFPLRPDTNDAVIYDAIVRRNEYRVPDRLRPDSLVVDIGMHVGAFSYLALMRGAGDVHGFEPEPSNYRRAAQNLAPFGARVHPVNRAVWRSDVPAAPLHFWPSTDAANTGGGSLIWETDGPLVEAVPFDEAIEAITNGGRQRISLLKIDCEGAEFPILLTSKRLDRVDRIVGEYHELRATPPTHVRIPGIEQFPVDLLVGCLQQAGFKTSTQWQATGKYGDMGLFFADRADRRRGPFGALRRLFQSVE